MILPRFKMMRTASVAAHGCTALAGDVRGGAGLAFQAYLFQVHVFYVGAAGCKAHGEGQVLLLGGHAVYDVEIFVKGHAVVGGKDEHGRAEAQRGGGDHIDPFFPGPVKERSADVKLKKVEAVQDHLDAFQKWVQVGVVDALGKWRDLQVRVDGQGLLAHDFQLGAGQNQVPGRRTGG